MPLHDIRVLDLSRLLPGPYCTMMLADFGAEVIKIEEPIIGDYARHLEPMLDENSAFFHQVNRNKKSVCLDLKTGTDKNHFLQLVEQSDVVVESFRPGTMEKLGLDYDTLKKINPGIIYCAITGYGQTGPDNQLAGHDLNYISQTGLLDLFGKKGEAPTVPATQIADIGGGAMPAVIGILLAILEKNTSGQGQFVDISMTDGALSWLPILFSEYAATGENLERGGQALSGAKANYNVYQTKDERYLAVAAMEPKFWEVFCETIGETDLTFKINAPQAEQAAMKQTIQQIIREKTLEEWSAIFADKEACVSAVLTFDEVTEHPQLQARDMFTSFEQPSSEQHKQLGIPIKLSQTPGTIENPAPKHGEHTEEILKNLIGAD